MLWGLRLDHMHPHSSTMYCSRCMAFMLCRLMQLLLLCADVGFSGFADGGAGLAYWGDSGGWQRRERRPHTRSSAAPRPRLSRLLRQPGRRCVWRAPFEGALDTAGHAALVKAAVAESGSAYALQVHQSPRGAASASYNNALKGANLAARLILSS